MRLICSNCGDTGKIISSKLYSVAECVCKNTWDPQIHEKEDEFYETQKKAGTVFSSLSE